MRVQVEHHCYPTDRRTEPRLIRELAVAHPRILLIWHPFFQIWQVYEKPQGSPWTASRLWHAIVSNHEHETRQFHDWQRTDWWKWRGAPVLVDELPMAPGWWLLDWLGQRDFTHVGAAQWYRDLEAREERRNRKRREYRHDMHHAVAADGYRHIRDHLRGDPLAGKRKWTAPVGIDLTQGGST